MNCKKCPNEFEPSSVDLLGVRIGLHGGLCPDCRREFLEESERQERTARMAELAKRRLQWRRSCGVPPRFINRDFTNFDRAKGIEEAIDACLKFAEGFPIEKALGYGSMVLYSERIWGNGKTHLACAVAHRILDRWQGETTVCPVKVITEPDMFRRWRATFDRRNNGEFWAETEQEVYNELVRVPLLIIDDVGKEEVSDAKFVQRTMFSIINGRYDNLLPVFLTANLSPGRLMMHLGRDRENEASYDRLVEMCGEKGFVKMKGASYRRGEYGNTQK